MKQLKRLTSVLLVLGIVLGLMPLSAFAAEPENAVATTFTVTEPVTGGENTYNYTLLNDGTYNYTLLNDGTAELTGFLPGVSVADAVIPSAVKGHPVTSIGESAFVNCTALQSVRFEAPIKSIIWILYRFNEYCASGRAGNDRTKCFCLLHQSGECHDSAEYSSD